MAPETIGELHQNEADSEKDRWPDPRMCTSV